MRACLETLGETGILKVSIWSEAELRPKVEVSRSQAQQVVSKAHRLWVEAPPAFLILERVENCIVIPHRRCPPPKDVVFLGGVGGGVTEHRCNIDRRV